MRSDAVELFADAVRAVGLDLDRASAPADRQIDGVLVHPTGGRLAGQPKKLSLATADGLARGIADRERESAGVTAVRVLVAEQACQGGRHTGTGRRCRRTRPRADAALHAERWLGEGVERSLMRVRTIPEGRDLDVDTLRLVGDLLRGSL
ncbi:MAG TPA: hypothetical protein VFW65_30855 [Pseudonocardiaceae bacterium]|nr:hypothetical protein [Pseudonocardiaceae bacterium]